MATNPSILAWEIPWTQEPFRLQSMGSQSQTPLSKRRSLIGQRKRRGVTLGRGVAGRGEGAGSGIIGACPQQAGLLHLGSHSEIAAFGGAGPAGAGGRARSDPASAADLTP